MTKKVKSNQPSAVYETMDICGFYNCSPCDIPMLIKSGTIPSPLPTSSHKAKKRWLKSKIHKHIGMDKNKGLSNDDISAIAAQVATLLKSNTKVY